MDKIVLILGYYDQLKSDMDYIALTCLSNIRECGVSVHRLFELFHYHSKDMIPFGDINKPVVEGALTFSHVQSSYGEKKVLHDLSFQIQPGEITAIVGKSGSGKTTILNAILRLYKIDSGRILLDNKSIYDYQELAFLQSVSVVTQKSFIFNFTIRENLSLVERHYEKQEEVCKMLGIHERILALPAGYDTKIEENGRYLSREVSQMISIARSILTGAKVLLFDEITSSLDQVNTRRAMEIFHQLKKDHTVIIITHKPEVMKVADHLLLLDQGRIVGDGSPSDLEQNPYYKKLQNLDRADSSEN